MFDKIFNRKTPEDQVNCSTANGTRDLKFENVMSKTMLSNFENYISKIWDKKANNLNQAILKNATDIWIKVTILQYIGIIVDYININLNNIKNVLFFDGGTFRNILNSECPHLDDTGLNITEGICNIGTLIQQIPGNLLELFWVIVINILSTIQEEFNGNFVSMHYILLSLVWFVLIKEMKALRIIINKCKKIDDDDSEVIEKDLKLLKNTILSSTAYLDAMKFLLREQIQQLEKAQYQKDVEESEMFEKLEKMQCFMEKEYMTINNRNEFIESIIAEHTTECNEALKDILNKNADLNKKLFELGSKSDKAAKFQNDVLQMIVQLQRLNHDTSD